MRRRAFLAGGLALVLAGCRARPAPIAYGRDECAWCRMTISDPRYGAELVTTTGRTYVFDSVECLAAFWLARRVPETSVASLWVADFAGGGLVPAGTASYLRSDALPSPMGLDLTAFARAADRDAAAARHGGAGLAWGAVLDVVAAHRSGGPRHSGAGAGHAG
jgi:copper chaperone NosL